jgi:hypothetical protein
VVASFSPPLRVEYQAAILDMLRDGKEVTFSLKDASHRFRRSWEQKSGRLWPRLR